MRCAGVDIFVGAGRIRSEQTALFIEAATDRPVNERWSGDLLDRKSFGKCEVVVVERHSGTFRRQFCWLWRLPFRIYLGRLF